MGRSVRISTIQLPASSRGSTPGERKLNNLKAILENVDEAGRRESDVAVFGEMANVIGLEFDRETLEEHADPVPGPLLDALSGAAREHSLNLIAPIIARIEGRLRNAALVIDRNGNLVGAYLKTHLPAPEADAGVIPGDELPVFELDFGRVGVMICMDIEYPEVALCLMLGGAEVIFFPHVQSSWGELDWEARSRLPMACAGESPGGPA
jgi:predicted amidohydrolase